jgi:hypothetical protein
MMSASTPTIIKFNGKVFRIDDKTKNKLLSCKGDGNVILNHNFNSSQFDSSTPADSSIVTRVTVDGVKKNVYPSTSTINISKSLLMLADPSYQVITPSNYTGYTLQGQYVAEGSFLNNIKTILNGLDQTSFWSNGRKTFFLEKDEGISTNVTFKSSQGDEGRGVRILDMGQSDSYMVNSVELIGRQFLLHKQESAGSVVNGNTHNLDHFPTNISIKNGSGNTLEQTTSTSGSDYHILYDERKVIFHSSHSGVEIDYDYEDVSSSSNNYYIGDDSNSITTYGKYARRYFVPQLTKQQDFSRLGQYLIINNKDTRQRYKIELPYLANNLRENHKITVTNKKGTATVVVKQITWHYPDSKTIIQAGENFIDGFDLEQNDSLILSNAISSIQKTKV